MSTERKIIPILSLALAVFLGFGGYETLKAHDAILHAEDQAKTTDALKKQQDVAMSERDALVKQYQQSITDQIAKVRSSQSAVQVIDRYVPAPAGQGATVVQKSDFSAAEQTKLPDAPSYSIETQQQAIATADKLLQCDADDHALNACQQNATTLQQQVKETDTEAQTWENAAKGGSKWQRILRSAKWFGIGAASGAVVFAVAHH
jgi:hypothetical protein